MLWRICRNLDCPHCHERLEPFGPSRVADVCARVWDPSFGACSPSALRSPPWATSGAIRSPGLCVRGLGYSVPAFGRRAHEGDAGDPVIARSRLKGRVSVRRPRWRSAAARPSTWASPTTTAKRPVPFLPNRGEATRHVLVSVIHEHPCDGGIGFAESREVVLGSISVTGRAVAR